MMISCLVITLASLMIAIISGMPISMHGVEREQQIEYDHIDYHRVANEFDLIDPQSISVHYSADGGSEYLNTDSFLRGSTSSSSGGGVRRLVVNPDNHPLAAQTVYTIEVMNGTDTPLGIKNHDIINITFSSSNPQQGDWIAAYSPADANISATVPVKWAYADVSPTYTTTGEGVLQFNFTNLRQNISFYYFTGGIGNNSCAVKSTLDFGYPDVYFIDPNEPLRPRIVPSGNPDIFKLLWNTNNSANPQLQWGTASGVYPNLVDADTSRLTEDMMCGGNAQGKGWRDTGAIHTAALEGMTSFAAGTLLYYRFGDSQTSTWSKEWTFLIPPQAGQQPPSRPTSAILLCDLGRGSMDDGETWNEYGRPSYNTSRFAAARALSGEVDAVFHGGDLSYARGYMAVWDFYMDQMGPLTSSVLYLSTVGNHESDWPDTSSIYNVTDSGGECGVAATTFYPMPEPATTDMPWWSYDVGIIHFVGMSTEQNFSVGSPQYDFLVADLAAVDRNLTPWIVFNGHRPMYVSSDFNDTTLDFSDLAVMDQLILNIEPILQRYQVNVAFWGHNHVYQRMTAVAQNCVVEESKEMTMDGETWNYYDTPQATVHMLVGNAGARFSDNAYPVNPTWCEDVQNFYGYNVITALNASYLTWVSYNTNQNDEEAIMDRIVVTQNVTNLGLDGWELPESTQECIAQQSAGHVSKVSFTQTTTFYVLIGVLSAVVLFSVCFLLYKRQMSAVKAAVSSSSRSDSDGEEYWKKRGVEDASDNTLRNPLTMNIA